MSAPDKYCFSVKIPAKGGFLFSINKYFKVNQKTADDNGTIYWANPKSGHYEFVDIHLWIINQEKQGFFIFHFYNEDDWLTLKEYIDEQNEKNKIPPIPLPVYRYNPKFNSWHVASDYKFKGRDELIGHDKYIKTIEKDIKNYLDHVDFLREIGETKSLNYLLHGVTGTGKSTLVRVFASQYNYPIFIVNPNGINPQFINDILNPIVATKSPIKIVLFEDFDRFLEGDNATNYISDILNGLDGINDQAGIVRFFSGNNCEKIFENTALINRMCGKFEFKYPTKEMYKGKLLRILSYHKKYDNDLLEMYLDLVITKTETTNITMRPFVAYSLRYLFEHNFLEQMIANLDELN